MSSYYEKIYQFACLKYLLITYLPTNYCLVKVIQSSPLKLNKPKLNKKPGKTSSINLSADTLFLPAVLRLRHVIPRFSYSNITSFHLLMSNYANIHIYSRFLQIQLVVKKHFSKSSFLLNEFFNVQLSLSLVTSSTRWYRYDCISIDW